MHPNHAALGDSGFVRRWGLAILMPLLALLVVVPACKNPAQPQNPVAPPVVGFTLSGFVSRTAADGGNTIGGALVEITSGAQAGTSTTTDSNGRYSIPGLSGQLNARYSSEGFVPTGQVFDMSRDVIANISLEREDGPPPPLPTFTLSGAVSEGQDDRDAIGGAVVEVVDGEHAGESATTDSRGEYTLPGLSGEITVRASRDGFGPEEDTVNMTEDSSVFFALFPPVQLTMCLDLDDEEVHITNNDPFNALTLTGWELREAVDGNLFTFVEDLSCRASMNGFAVPAGATVIITSGNSPTHSPPTHIAGWCKSVWKQDGDTAWLARGDGTRIAEAIGSFDSCGG